MRGLNSPVTNFQQFIVGLGFRVFKQTVCAITLNTLLLFFPGECHISKKAAPSQVIIINMPVLILIGARATGNKTL